MELESADGVVAAATAKDIDPAHLLLIPNIASNIFSNFLPRRTSSSKYPISVPSEDITTLKNCRLVASAWNEVVTPILHQMTWISDLKQFNELCALVKEKKLPEDTLYSRLDLCQLPLRDTRCLGGFRNATYIKSLQLTFHVDVKTLFNFGGLEDFLRNCVNLEELHINIFFTQRRLVATPVVVEEEVEDEYNFAQSYMALPLQALLGRMGQDFPLKSVELTFLSLVDEDGIFKSWKLMRHRRALFCSLAALINSCPTLEVLKVLSKNVDVEDLFLVLEESDPFLNLKGLRLKEDDVAQRNSTVIGQAAFTSLEFLSVRPHWRMLGATETKTLHLHGELFDGVAHTLKRLVIHSELGVGKQGTIIEAFVFEMILQCLPNLELLHLGKSALLPFMKHQKEEDAVRISHPKLKQLIMSGAGSGTTEFEIFLQIFPALEYFHFEHRGPARFSNSLRLPFVAMAFHNAVLPPVLQEVVIADFSFNKNQPNKWDGPVAAIDHQQKESLALLLDKLKTVPKFKRLQLIELPFPNWARTALKKNAAGIEFKFDTNILEVAKRRPDLYYL